MIEMDGCIIESRKLRPVECGENLMHQDQCQWLADITTDIYTCKAQILKLFLEEHFLDFYHLS